LLFLSLCYDISKKGSKVLKRQQVLLTDWLVDYIKFLSEKYDVSFSEIIRITLCLRLGRIISSVFPKHKFAINEQEIIKILKRAGKRKRTEEEQYRLISRVYFEARKTIESRLSALKKQKNPFLIYNPIFHDKKLLLKKKA
jgi:hypothetical protein